jgi:UDP-N-acetylmuramoylalanine--D-glutamate ligase
MAFMILEEIENRATALLGFGVEGQSTYEFLRGRFPRKPLVIADRQPLEKLDIRPDVLELLRGDGAVSLNCGDDDARALGQQEVIIKAPGIPYTHPALSAAESRGALITSQLEIFFELCDRRRTVGVTGTKGKSTTSSLLNKILVTAGMDASLCGNIGEPPLSKIKEASPKTLFVLELSSYQLERLKTSPHIAVLLNIVPEHLDYHQGFQAYVSAKENITRFQDAGDFLVFNQDYPLPAEIARRTRARPFPFSMRSGVQPGCYIAGGGIRFSDAEAEREVLALSDIPLLGEFNRQNVLAAVAAASLLGAPPAAVREAVRDFKALPHRLEFVGEYEGVLFYDDSISTVPECTLSALSALGPSVQTLILGGHDRHLDYADFARQLLSSSVENLILFPPTGRMIWGAIESADEGAARRFKVFPVETMEEAIGIAFANTAPGRTCLLSPASPSYSNFKNYRARGEAFKRCIRALAGRSFGA